MGSIGSSVDGGNDFNSSQHTGTKGSHNRRVPASEEPYKDGSPIADDDRHDSSSSQHGRPTILRRIWHWSMRNLTVIALVSLVIAGLVAITVSFGALYHQEPALKPAGICLTPACVLAASEILQSLSPRYQDIDPCDEFDKYVCEGWEEQHDLRPDQSTAFTGTIMHERSQQILRHALESSISNEDSLMEATSSPDKLIFGKAQDAYDACMDEEKLRAIGSGPLIEVLRVIEKLFPAVAPDRVSGNPHLPFQHQKPLFIKEVADENLTKIITYLEKTGVTALISLGIGADDKDPDSVILSLNAPRRPGLPSKEYYKNPEIVLRYSRIIGEVLEALLREARPQSLGSLAEYRKRNQHLVKAVVDLESQLADATPDAEDAQDITKSYNPRSLAEVEFLLPQLSIRSVVSSLAPHSYNPDRIIVGSPKYLTKLSTILEGSTVETLQTYFVWKTVQTYGYEVEDEALKPLKRFNNELQGKEPDALEERWRTCIRVVDYGLGWILSKLFVEKAFSEDAKEFGDRIVSDIKEQFIDKLDAAEWMSKDVRKLGIRKVHNIVQKIGYPTKSPDIRNASLLENYYDSVNISKAAFFENALSIAHFDTHREWSALGKPTDRDEWGMTVPTVNAYYNPAGNEIVFPAGIMQSPVFYDPQVPQYLSYGAFGSVSGHELSHAFDSTGRHYDETGNLTEWWDNATVHTFEAKVQCFVDQYHEFKVPGLDNKPLHVNGRLTLGENIADAGGLSASFQAWKKREAQNPTQILPGLQQFSKEQLFFVSYSSWWCGKTRKEAAVDGIYRDPHSPMWARIRGTTANSREFRESFGCPVKEPTCELW